MPIGKDLDLTACASLKLTATIGEEPSEEQCEALTEGLQTRSGDGFELVCLVTLVTHKRHNDRRRGHDARRAMWMRTHSTFCFDD